ncbi:hypothetical protein ATZ36_13125 [Candidatus Endomicrobiellum trichonymphae]|uniref:Uncharacterized protein n=1 Tax=Endomicrobium trichonymphae TaxID=1408204 RepID=A0A1E5IMP6_ENDTX|nr:hypothetical protein ATZ36_13125 [Candidatus Endomicrobium trichonymphae]
MTEDIIKNPACGPARTAANTPPIRCAEVADCMGTLNIWKANIHRAAIVSFWRCLSALLESPFTQTSLLILLLFPVGTFVNIVAVLRALLRQNPSMPNAPASNPPDKLLFRNPSGICIKPPI